MYTPTHTHNRYWIVYLGSASINAAWAAIMTMVSILGLMAQYNASLGLTQGIGYGLLALYALIGTFFGGVTLVAHTHFARCSKDYTSPPFHTHSHILGACVA